MGTWNVGLFDCDTTCDVRETYMQFLEQQLNNDEAYQKTCEEYKELMGTEEEALFWYALADTQWNMGRLMPNVKENSIKYIRKGGGSYIWAENEKELHKWEGTLHRLREKLETSMPPEKKIKKNIDFIRNPWEVGDVYAYQFHTQKAKKYGVYNHYILFQKIGNVEYYDKVVFSAVQVFDYIFEYLPILDDIQGLRILPLADPPGVNGAPNNIEDYIPSFEWYMKATMIYDKKVHYPKKHFTRIGKCNIQQKEIAANELTDLYWDKDGMEEWLLNFYFNWEKIEYRNKG